jgi:predicted Zn-dependent protease
MDERAGDEALLGALQRALEDASVQAADLYVHRVHRGFARFSLNALNQHAQTIEPQASARVGIPGPNGWRVATATTTDLSHDALVASLHRARAIAERSVPIPDWPGFFRGGGTTPTPPRYAEPTAQASAATRAELLAPALAHARANALTAAGALETSVYETAMASTEGVRRHATGTFATFRMFAHDADGVTGFAQSTHRDVGCIDVLARAREACARSLAGRDPIALPAGEYDVILEPPAVTELLEWMSFIAFGARDVLDGTSALAGNEGKAITGPDVTIVDDACGNDDLAFGVPFDRDGVVRQRVVLIEKGVAKLPVYDRVYGARSGRESTGHATAPGPGGDAPIAQAISLAGGGDTLEGLAARVERGLHISRFHYVNGFLEPRRALMTGLTRDGTFLIEHGQRTRGVRNMRFTDSVLEAFKRIDGVTALREAVPTWWSEAGAFVAPALLVRGLRFSSGGTERPSS